MLDITIPTSHPVDYFTLRPPGYEHFSTETPLVSPDTFSEETTAIPTNPLLACRGPFSNPTSPTKDTSPAPTFLQMQTNASHPRPASRPEPSPLQNVLHITSNNSDKSADSASSSSSSSNGMRASSIDFARCSRCHRTPSIDAKTGKNNMVQYGLNLWYCTRCAQMVGLGVR